MMILGNRHEEGAKMTVRKFNDCIDDTGRRVLQVSQNNGQHQSKGVEWEEY